VSSKRLAKRFYKVVTVKAIDEAWQVLLDGMPLRTPGKIRLSVPFKALAIMIAGEWERQIERINPSLMPITRLVNVAIEQTPDRRKDLIAEARRYAETDLICYRAPEPRILKERQSAAWDEWRTWAARQGVDLKTTEALNAIEQPEESLAEVERFAESLDDLHLTLFVHFVAVFGSVILAMAVMKRQLTSVEAFEISRLDAIYQIELWGEDEEQAEITAALREETNALGAVLKHLS